jgi:hypothetical protein
MNSMKKASTPSMTAYGTPMSQRPTPTRTAMIAANVNVPRT